MHKYNERHVTLECTRWNISEIHPTKTSVVLPHWSPLWCTREIVRYNPQRANRFAGAATSAGRHAARLFYRTVGIPSDRNWRYQLAGGINLMAARHRSSSLLVRRNVFDTGALIIVAVVIVVITWIPYPPLLPPIVSLSSFSLSPFSFPLISLSNSVIAVSSSLQREKLVQDNKLNRILRANKLTLY